MKLSSHGHGPPLRGEFVVFPTLPPQLLQVFKYNSFGTQHTKIFYCISHVHVVCSNKKRRKDGTVSFVFLLKLAFICLCMYVRFFSKYTRAIIITDDGCRKIRQKASHRCSMYYILVVATSPFVDESNNELGHRYTVKESNSPSLTFGANKPRKIIVSP